MMSSLETFDVEQKHVFVWTCGNTNEVGAMNKWYVAV